MCNKCEERRKKAQETLEKLKELLIFEKNSLKLARNKQKNRKTK